MSIQYLSSGSAPCESNNNVKREMEMSTPSEEIQEKIISLVKQEFGLNENPVAVEYVKEMDMLAIQFSNDEADSTEDAAIGDYLVVVEKKGDKIISVDFMGVSSFK